MVTIKDVAQRAGVSTAVVSAVLGGRSRTVRMSEATRERVTQAIAEIGYSANHAAKSLSLSRTGVIAAVVPKIANPVFEYVIRGMHHAAESHGEVLMLADSMWIEPGTHLMGRMAGSGMVDGFLVRTAEWGSERTEEFTKRRLPFVVLNTPRSPEDGYPPDDMTRVWIDDHAGFHLLGSHLTGLGHRRIGYVGGPNSLSGHRMAGLIDAMAEAGHTVDPGLMHGVGYDLDRIAQVAREVLTRPDRPTALVVDNVIAAPAVLAVAAELGLSVPEQLSIVAFQDLPAADWMRPAPTTVRMPLFETGIRAYEVLHALIAGEKASSEIVNDPVPELVDRGSTAPPPSH